MEEINDSIFNDSVNIIWIERNCMSLCIVLRKQIIQSGGWYLWKGFKYQIGSGISQSIDCFYNFWSLNIVIWSTEWDVSSSLFECLQMTSFKNNRAKCLTIFLFLKNKNCSTWKFMFFSIFWIFVGLWRSGQSRENNNKHTLVVNLNFLLIHCSF